MKKTVLPRDGAFLDQPHNPDDPDPWQTLWLDRSTPIAPHAKRVWLHDSNSVSRQYMLPFVRPVCRLAIVTIQIIKSLTPDWLASPRLLHRLLAWALSVFATPEANWIILRHFWIGSEILAFLNANIRGAGVETTPLRPMDVPELRDNVFIQHDINLFNFITRINLKLRDHGIEDIEPQSVLDYSMISDGGHFPIAPQNCGWLNVIDLQTCIELFTPVYQLFLSDRDFWRAAHSLQFDETVGLYAAKVLGAPEQLVLINNKHPLAVPPTWTAGYRLVLHGLSAEMLHGLLVRKKNEQQIHRSHSVVGHDKTSCRNSLVTPDSQPLA